MNIETDIKKLIAEASNKIGIEVVTGDIELEHPTEISFGDFSTNVAMAFAKKIGKAPRELAEEIIKNIDTKEYPFLEKISVAGPGFINISLSRKFFDEIGEEAIKGDFGSINLFKGKKIMIEYTNTNIFKELHIGHLMSNTVGESVSRILKNSGAEVKNSTYQGDVGLHIAKAIWGMKKDADKMPDEKSSISEKTAFLGSVYAKGSVAYEEDEKAKVEIVSINKHIYNKDDQEINELYKWGRKVSLEHFEEVYEKLDTHFDYYFFEGDVSDLGLSIVKEFLKKGVFEKSEGAIVFPGEKFGLHTRVFINSEGLPTYEAKDIGNTIKKYETYKFDENIIVTAVEQKGYFEVVFKALEQIDKDIALKMKHLPHGMLRLPTGKMGSRKGNVITGEGLIDRASELVREKMKDRDISPNEKEEIILEIAVGAIRYSILKHTLGSDIIFDFEKSISFEGNSGPYLQYSYTRAIAILDKAKKEGLQVSIKDKPKNIYNLEKLISRFPEITKRSAVEYSPHHIALYLTDLASEFNSWYAKEKIVDIDDADSPYKIATTEMFANVMKKGLSLLGIKTPRKM